MNVPATRPARLGRVQPSIAAMARRIAVTGALAVAVCGLSVSSASAGQNAYVWGKYGHVKFEQYGEVLTASDDWHDGYGVRAYLHWGGNQSAGVTDDGPEPYPESRNLSIPEGTKVSLTMCYTNNGADVRCSDYELGEA